MQELAWHLQKTGRAGARGEEGEAEELVEGERQEGAKEAEVMEGSRGRNRTQQTWIELL